MHHLSTELSLKEITLGNHSQLQELMYRIYPPVYKHLWPDNGDWYLNQIYAKENLQDELNNPNSRYYFVMYDFETIGILRVLLNEGITGVGSNHAIKLQRIYLDPIVQGKGIGSQLIHWVEREFGSKEKSLVWLEVMDSQISAIKFYEKLGFKIVDAFTFESVFEF